MMSSSRLSALRRRAPLALLLVFAASCFGDCYDPLSESARNGDPQALAAVSYDRVADARLPAVVYSDSQRVVRIIADTVRLYPDQQRYRRKTVYGAATGGPEVHVLQPATWVTRTMYEVHDIVDWHVVLDSFDIAPGLAPGSARWDSHGTDTAFVYVQRETRMDVDSLAPGTHAYIGKWAPARPRKR